MQTLRTIRLYGKLGAQFGRVHRLAVATTAEAVRALSALLPGFERELLASRERGVTYAVFVGHRNITEVELQHPAGDDIRIAPVLVGSKRQGALQTIAGAVLIVVGAVLTFYGYGAVGEPMIKLGITMAVGGVIQMLSAPRVGLGSKDSSGNSASYSFNGAVNTTAQGNPVPLLYGRMIVGSAVVSAGIYAEDQQ